MAVIAESWQREGRLKGGGIVATVMSNLGFERYLQGIGLSMHRTQVGDRYVVEHMVAEGYNLGGEQSGHIVLTDYCTTGDALVAALQALAVFADQAQPVSRRGSWSRCRSCCGTSGFTAARRWRTPRCSARWKRRGCAWGTAAGCWCAIPAPSR